MFIWPVGVTIHSLYSKAKANNEKKKKNPWVCMDLNTECVVILIVLVFI